jgi:hypothetical protein
MLLGMEFLQKVDASLECSGGTLTVGNQKISLQLSASVLTVRCTVLPPNSARFAECELSTRVSEFMVDSSSLVTEGSMVAKSVHASAVKPGYLHI